MSKYDEMKEFYEKQVIELKKQADHYMAKYFDECCAHRQDAGKIELYEKVLNKLIGENNNHSDQIVMFDGKTYVVNGFTLEHNQEGPDTLTVDCTRIGILS